MKYHNITKDDMKNGEGLRVVLWVSGCDHGCKGCHNMNTWDKNSGINFDENAENELINHLNKEYISGLTISGGDPLFTENREEVTRICKNIKEKFPNKTIWIYTGYTFEDIQDLEIFKFVDVVVDGKYEEKLADSKLHWKGSSNQRVIYLNKLKD